MAFESRSIIPRTLAPLSCVTLLAAGCGGKGPGHDGPAAGADLHRPRQGEGTILFLLTDACAGGGSASVRFFDVHNGLEAPGPGRAHIVAPSSSASFGLACEPNADVCLGAETRDGLVTWGVGLDGTRACTDCCARCLGQTVSSTLACDRARRQAGSQQGSLRMERGEPDSDHSPILERMRGD
jgi:hypothetical protein